MQMMCNVMQCIAMFAMLAIVAMSEMLCPLAIAVAIIVGNERVKMHE